MKKTLSVILCLAMLSGLLTFFVSAQDASLLIDDALETSEFVYSENAGDTEDLFSDSADDAERVTVYYDVDGQLFTDTFYVDETVTLSSSLAMRQFDDRMIVGWKTESGEEYYYDNTDLYSAFGETDIRLQSGETRTFYPIWCPIALQKEEVFSFTNDEYIFNPDGEGTYLTRQHYSHLALNWLTTFMLSPLALPAALLGTFFLTKWMSDWHGACCGFAISTLLQHYGKIDLLSAQGVSDVCELEPDKEIISTLNYYNIQAAPGCLGNHVAIQPGTEEYSDQLHALYDALASGKPAYFEQYGDLPHVLRIILSFPFKRLREQLDLTGRGMYHGVVLTGAYTDDCGNHILIMYDNNSEKYVNGTCDVLYIDPDFTQIYSPYAEDNNHALNGFTWNDTFDQFDSFKAEGISNPFAWHIQFMKNFPSLTRQFVTLFKTK